MRRRKEKEKKLLLVENSREERWHKRWTCAVITHTQSQKKKKMSGLRSNKSDVLPSLDERSASFSFLFTFLATLYMFTSKHP